MRLIFKYIAIFLPFSLFTQEVDEIEVVKVSEVDADLEELKRSIDKK